MRVILWLEEIEAEDGAQVGSKALNLAEIARAGFYMPAGFCIAAAAYQDYVAANGLEPAIHSLPSLPAVQVRAAASRLREAIRAGQMSPQVPKAILSAYQELMAGRGTMHLAVAVRSSASAEDLPTASFAGQQDTLLNVRDEQ